MLPLDSGSLGPQAFQVVKAAHRFVKNVDDYVSIIHKDPVAFSFSLDSDWFESPGFEFVFNVVGDPLYLPSGFSAANDKIVSKGGKPADLQKNQIEGFETQSLPGAQDGFFLAAHLYSEIFALLFSSRDTQIRHHFPLHVRNAAC